MDTERSPHSNIFIGKEVAAMRKAHTSVLVVAFSLLTVTARSTADDCWNLAHRYCCDLAFGFVIQCTGDLLCFGEVHNGINEFKPTKIDPTTGAMTDASFQLVGSYNCEYYPPRCNLEPEPWCDLFPNYVHVQCSEWKLKTQFAFCTEY